MAEILEIFKFLFALTFIFYIIFAWMRSANLYRLSGGILCLLTLIISTVLVCGLMFTSIIDIPINSTESYILVFVCAVALILLLLVFKAQITGAIRIIDYYIHKEKVFAQGYKDIGTIIDIKRSYFSRRHHPYRRINICYLIVDYNGEKIKSLYFLDDEHPKTYSLGENIDVMVYDKYKYVILDENTN